MDYELDSNDAIVAIVQQAAELRPLVEQVGVKNIADVVAIIKLVLEVIASLKKLRS